MKILLTVAGIVLAIGLAAAGVLLARYAEMDDAPGGVVIGWLMVMGALVLAVWTVQRARRV